MRKLSTRIGDNWLVLTHVKECTWQLQVWGSIPLEAEVTAEDETAAKDAAIAATIERLRIKPFSNPSAWNTVITRYWDSGW